MADPYVAEIRLFAGNYAPTRWALCNGQILPITQNSALFSLIGTTYGGDGRSTFGLPDMQGRIPVHQGTGPGLSRRPLGQKYGAESISLLASQMPSHSHHFQVSSDSASAATPSNMVLGSVESPDAFYTMTPESGAALTQMNKNSTINTGHSQPHSNMMSYQAITFILSLTGIYPSRN
ncbi:phage tail protein [Bacterioplanoides pacificum]|uniref:Phage tail protein n=1 Tax=Bacterioplanoides pacificum TaxID=1171596 RepID=A0ABV7VRH5_9GAMM